MKYAVRSLLLSILAVAALSCDKAIPTAPEGSILTVSASPSRIGVNGSSNITIMGRRSNGSPLAPGTEIRLTTTIGTIPSLVTLDGDGEATAVLRGDGRLGVARVTASAGTVTGGGSGSGSGSGGTGGSGGSGTGTGSGTSSGILTATVDVEVGNAGKTIVLQASPTNLSSEGGDVRLTALVRDATGQPLQGAQVNFLTDLGRLKSGGGLKQTDANGQATDTLTVTENDITISDTTGFSVTAQTAGADGALISDDFQIQVQSNRPIADFTVRSAGQFKVQFTSTSTGLEPLTFDWVFGDGETSTERNPVHDYKTQGRFTVTLSVSNTFGEAVEVKQIFVESGKVTIE